MKIAQVAPLYESVPPRCYGGTERVVSYLTEELVKMGHEVTLFASGDSVTEAELVEVCPGALRLNGNCVDPIAHHVLMLERVVGSAERFDIIHFHIDYLHFPLVRRLNTPSVTTLHGRLDVTDYRALFSEFRDIPLVSISYSQRTPLSFANWQGTVYHGLPRRLYRPGDGGGGYLAFVGRLSPEKRPDRAIKIALRSGMPLKMAAKVDRVDMEYFEEVVKPLLKEPGVEYIGEIGEREKQRFLADAYALLFPIDWPEPFGLVMIESMACGTPVVAWRNGSVPEVIDHGVTGYVVDSIDEAVDAVEKVEELDRRKIRKVFEERFSSERMARQYLQIYEKLIHREKTPPLFAIQG